MRDIVLTTFILASLPFILWRPQIGVLMYIWISVMNPHRLTWSFASELQFAAIVGATTLGAVLLSKDLRRPPADALMVLMILFWFSTGLSTIFALYPEGSFERWKALSKTILMASLIPMLFHRKEDLRLLVWVIVISIGFYGTKGGIWTLLTGGIARVWGPMESYIADNNAIAVAIIMVMPLMRYLQITSPYRCVRWMLLAMMLFCGVAVLGTYSRGAFLAVFAMLAFLWWKGKHKLPVLFTLIMVISFALSSMPEKWYARMDTIRNYHEVGSAQMRLNAWATMTNIANDRPLVGGGFELAQPFIFERYSPGKEFPPQVAHSIYFQALGEHGYLGFALYMFMLLAFWLKARKIAEYAQGRSDLAWAAHMASMMQVTLVGFGVGGVFLSLVNFDVPYYLIGLMVATVALLERSMKEESRSDRSLRTERPLTVERTLPIAR